MAALTRKSIPSPNYSSRGGATVRLIVIHTAEGARTIEELGNFFASSSSGVSSHTGIDDTPGVIGEYVKRPNKAWTAGNANPVAVQTELCAFAAWTPAEWSKHPNMLENCARWVAEEAAYFGVPIAKLSASEAQGAGRGVCQHNDLDEWGGGHWDCGGGFPIDDVLEMARGGGGDDEMGYPEWYWDWASWYLTTERDNSKRPANAPATIPEWAWDANDELAKVGTRYGMTGGEREWITWYLAGKKGERPNVPQTIPDRWWDDERYVLARDK
jgi:N-acetylmuramoyl-L-alanine amidase-like protein